MKKTLILTFLAAALLLPGCSCERRMQRLERLCPDCFAKDTLHLTDTVVPPPVLIFEHLPWDSLNHNGQFVLDRPDYTFNVTVSDSGVDIEGEVRPDTLILTRDVPVMVPCPEEKKDIHWLSVAAIAIFLILIIIDTFKRRKP